MVRCSENKKTVIKINFMEFNYLFKKKAFIRKIVLDKL